MNRKIFTALGFLALITSAWLAVSEPAEAENVVIGAFLPLSGHNVVIGHMQKNAMLLALDEVNARGLIAGGRSLELDIRNAGRRPEDTRTTVNHFIRDKQYPVIIGGGGSGAAAEAARLCERGRTPLIIISGSEDSITMDGLDYVFRIAPPRSHYGDAAMEYTREVIRPDRIALIAERSDFGQAMTDLIRDAAAEEGWDLVYEAVIDPGGVGSAGVDAGSDVKKADTVYLALFPPDTGRIMKDIRAAGLHKKVVVSLAPSSASAGAFAVCGGDCRGVFSSALWFRGASTSADSFYYRYLKKYGIQPDYHAAQAYAAVLAAASALRNVEVTNRQAVRGALEKTRIGSPLGTVTFGDWDTFDNQNRPESYLFQWSGDRFEVVWPERYRTAETIR